MAASIDARAPAGTLAFGVMGNVTSLEKDFALSTVLVLGETGGVNGALREWGAAMRAWSAKPDAAAARARDVTLQYIGYTTDNGAYYYYNTGEFGDYLAALEGVKAYSDSIGVPYACVAAA